MKNFTSSAIILTIALMAFGCNKEERALFSDDGQWKTTKQTDQFYVSDTLVFTETEILLTEVTFKKDGTGTLKEDGESFVTSWSLNDDGDVLNLCTFEGSISTCRDITLVESTKDKQKWHTELVDGNVRFVSDYELARK
jgi:hypothetical protein